MPKLGIYYEHPTWFERLFSVLEGHDVAYEKIDASGHSFDPAVRPENAVVFNRMSASAYLRGNANAIFYTRGYLAYLERSGVRVINGYDAYQVEISKALQLSLITSLGLHSPKTLVVNSLDQLKDLAGFTFPAVLKPNIGGRGAGIVKFDSIEELRQANAAGQLELGIDETALLQEFVSKRDGNIVRVETLGGRFLYGLKIFPQGENFNLCPAEACAVERTEEIGAYCLQDAPPVGMKIESYTPPDEIIAAVERIVAAAKIDVGGVEYMIDDRTGEPLFYDINALSNFVANAEELIGFDPHENLVDFLTEELEKCDLDTGCRSSAAG